MTTVRELIKDSVFTTAKGFEKLTPEVTVILPTFRRGDNGLFALSVNTLLQQSFSNFELIIVDDASTDSTAQQIREFMEQDPRVAVIRHTRNIGLPAVSEIEGFFKARGDFLFFAFDDNEFTPDAIEELYAFFQTHPAAAVHSKAKMLLKSRHVLLGEKEATYNNLVLDNFIPNSALMIRRQLVEETGFYDPHVSMTRICDWDLWCRISKKHILHKLDKILSVEKGCLQQDSIGNSYPAYPSLIREWMARDRNELLKPENILDYSVDNIPSDISLYSAERIQWLLDTKFKNFSWNKGEKYPFPNDKYILFLTAQRVPQTDEYLSTSEKFLPGRVIISHQDIHFEILLPLIGNATAIIFNDTPADIVLALCKYAKIPYFYYDQELCLSEKIGTYAPRYMSGADLNAFFSKGPLFYKIRYNFYKIIGKLCVGKSRKKYSSKYKTFKRIYKFLKNENKEVFLK